MMRFSFLHHLRHNTPEKAFPKLQKALYYEKNTQDGRVMARERF
jgi:hypothetical protein